MILGDERAKDLTIVDCKKAIPDFWLEPDLNAVKVTPTLFQSAVSEQTLPIASAWLTDLTMLVRNPSFELLPGAISAMVPPNARE